MKRLFLLHLLLPLMLTAADFRTDFLQLANKKGSVGDSEKICVFNTPEWKTWIAKARTSPQMFEYLLYSFSNYSPTKIYLHSWGNAPQGLLALLTVQEITGRSWLDYKGSNKTIKSAIAKGKKMYPYYSLMVQLINTPAARVELQRFFRSCYYGAKPVAPLPQAELTARAEKKLAAVYGKDVLKQRPWKILQDDHTITFTGTLHQPDRGYKLGGTAFIILRKSSGEVLYFIHGK